MLWHARRCTALQPVNCSQNWLSVVCLPDIFTSIHHLTRRRHNSSRLAGQVCDFATVITPSYFINNCLGHRKQALLKWLLGVHLYRSTSQCLQRCLFFLYIALRRYKQKSVEVGVFSKGVGHFERKFQTEGGVAQQSVFLSEN